MSNIVHWLCCGHTYSSDSPSDIWDPAGYTSWLYSPSTLYWVWDQRQSWLSSVYRVRNQKVLWRHALYQGPCMMIARPGSSCGSANVVGRALFFWNLPPRDTKKLMLRALRLQRSSHQTHRFGGPSWCAQTWFTEPPCGRAMISCQSPNQSVMLLGWLGGNGCNSVD
jgi:hypothetical protein